MNEPKKSQTVLDQMQKIRDEAFQNGHSLGEWKLDYRGYWRTCCDNRNCNCSAWVNSPVESGGSIGGECFARQYNRIMDKGG